MANNQIKKLTGKGRINRRRVANDIAPKNWWDNSRRRFIVGGALAAGAVVAGGLLLANRDDSTDIDKDSLELQRSSGWNVGSEDKRLTLSGAQTLDSQGNGGWNKYLDQNAMLSVYQPKSAQWTPFFVPTLIQSLQFESLRSQLSPIFTPDMQEAYGRGQAIAKDFVANAENRGETAIVVDVPGRDAVAFGAGLADVGRLIPLFDNFPHPLGVTPSHETLAAMLYYAGEIDAKQQSAPADDPPVFLIDSQRLAPYSDADTQFDNRYLAKLPSAQKFKEMGIKSLIYITPDRTRTQELDDLNEDFVEYRNQGLNVAMLPLSDFVKVNDGGSTAGTSGYTGSWGDSNGGSRYYYGGSPASHIWFFHSYPFYHPYGSYARTSGLRAPSAAPPLSPPSYTPISRPTIFSGTRIGSSSLSGVGRSKPSGFGRATVRVSPSQGVIGTRAGRSGFYSPGRSGSFGRGGLFGG
jgi:hypothetical protein